jgi:ABC-2 type transport system permease protein
MRNTLTIAGKELQGYFVQPVAYVVLTVFLLLGGWFFFSMLRQFDEMVQLIQMMGQQGQLGQMNLNTRVIDPLLHDLSIVLVIVMPALTMRVFAEEKRTGTYE